MADVKISALPAATTPLAGTEVLPIVQSSTTKQVAVADLTAGRAMSATSLTLTTPLSVANGGTGLTSLTAGYIPYGNGTGAFGTNGAFWDSANGRLGVGTASPNATLDVNGYGFFRNSGGTAQITLYQASGVSMDVGTNATSSFVYSYSAIPLLFGANGSERMRIDSSGNLLVGTTSASFSSTNYGIVLKPNAETFWITNTPGNIIAFNRNSDGGIFKFFRSGTEVGSVTVTTTATTYGTSSDISLKEKISDASSALSSILSMPIRQFDWKADGSHTDYGVIAQEANEFAPEIVAKKDIWQVDYGRITPRLIKAFQELAAEVAALKGQLNG